MITACKALLLGPSEALSIAQKLSKLTFRAMNTRQQAKTIPGAFKVASSKKRSPMPSCTRHWTRYRTESGASCVWWSGGGRLRLTSSLRGWDKPSVVVPSATLTRKPRAPRRGWLIGHPGSAEWTQPKRDKVEGIGSGGFDVWVRGSQQPHRPLCQKARENARKAYVESTWMRPSYRGNSTDGETKVIDNHFQVCVREGERRSDGSAGSDIWVRDSRQLHRLLH